MRDDQLDHHICDACGGTGKPVSGLKCMCGGSGKMIDAFYYLRERIVETELENGRLRECLSELTDAVITRPVSRGGNGEQSTDDRFNLALETAVSVLRGKR